MTIQTAIQKAVEGGWDKTRATLDFNEGGGEQIWESDMILDPLFWQALGKSMGWDGTDCLHNGCKDHPSKEWKVRWHELIDHLAEGKSIEDYFNDLK